MTRTTPVLTAALLALVAAAPLGHADPTPTTYWEILHFTPGQLAGTTLHFDEPYDHKAAFLMTLFHENKTPIFELWGRFIHTENGVRLQTNATGSIEEGLVTMGTAGGWTEWKLQYDEGYMLVAVVSEGPLAITHQNGSSLQGQTNGTSAYYYTQDDFTGFADVDAYEQPIVEGVLVAGSTGAYAKVHSAKSVAVQNELVGLFARDSSVPQDLHVTGPTGTTVCAGSPSATAKLEPRNSCFWWDPTPANASAAAAFGPTVPKLPDLSEDLSKKTLPAGDYAFTIDGAGVSAYSEVGVYLLGADVVWP